MDATTVLTQVNTFHGTNDRGPWTKTVFKDQNGLEFATFKGEIASKAQSLLNQPVRIEYVEAQNGQYTNRTLQDVQALNGNAPVVGAATPTVGLVQPTVSSPHPEQFMRRRDPSETLAIHKQSGLQRAIETFAVAGVDPLADLEGLFQLSDRYIGYFNETDLRDS